MSESDSSAFLNQLFSLEGKEAVVIVGTGVPCRAMAWGLWRAGCREVLIWRNRGKAESYFKGWGSPPDEARFFKADVTRRDQLPHNPIQAQRDFLGAHTYVRVDREGVFRMGCYDSEK